MPTTSVENSNGTISDLIIRRKMFANGLRLGAKSGASQPIRMPITIEIRIHCEELMPRNPRLGDVGVTAGEVAMVSRVSMVKRRQHVTRCTGIAQNRMPVAVQEIAGEADRHPHAKRNPCADR